MKMQIKSFLRHHFLKILLMMGLFSGIMTLILGIDLVLSTVGGGALVIAIALTFSSFAGFAGSLWFCLKSSEERMATLRLLEAIELLDQPILVTNSKGEPLFCNNGFSHLFQGAAPIQDFNAFLRRIDGNVPENVGNDQFVLTADYLLNTGLYQHEIPVLYQKNPDRYYYFKRSTLGPNHDIVWRLQDETAHVREFRAALYAQSTFLKKFDTREIFDLAPVGIVILDDAGVIQVYNQRFAQTFLQTEKSVIGQPFQMLLGAEKRLFFTEAFASFRAGRFPELRPIEMSFANNEDLASICYFGSLGASVSPEKGAVLYIFDNRPQQEMQKKLSSAQRLQAMGQLSGGIAHDFNNLLTAMIGFSDLLLSRLSPADQSFTDMMQIKQNAHRAANLVRQLLAFSRQQSLVPTVIQVSDILSNLSALLDRLIGVHIRLRIVHGRSVGYMRVDTGQLEQVLINLVVNARDAIDDRGEIIIRTGSRQITEPLSIGIETIAPGNYICIDVIDTGRGIPPEIIGRIFDPFYSTKEVGSGTGLGLSTVYGIVRQTGGYITVESTVGVGTTFTLYFPEHTNDDSASGPQATAASTPLMDSMPAMADLTGNGTILIVEDEDAVRLFSARALREKGYTVIEASSGEEGLTHIRNTASLNGSIDLVITDVIMPVMDGPSMVERARQLYPDLRVIFISGYTFDSFRAELSQKDLVHFLPKPFSLKDLAEKVKSVINTPYPPGYGPEKQQTKNHLPPELENQESVTA